MPYRFNPFTGQLDLIGVSPPPPPGIDQVNTDSGTATPIAGIINIFGGTAISTSALGNTVTIDLLDPLAVPNGGTGASTFTSGGILLGNGMGNLQVTSQPTDGQLLMGSTGVSPVLNTITAGNGITITNGTGTITIDADNNGDVVGPASSTDQDIAIFDGLTGKLIEDGGVTLPTTDGQLIIGDTGSVPLLGTITQPAAGITVTNGPGTITLALANDLAGLEGLSTTGLAQRTGTSTWATQTFVDYTAFTPALTSSGGGESVTYVVRTGHYMKIGRLVHITLTMQVATVSGGSGDMRISNLPFAFANTASESQELQIAINNTAFTAGIIYIVGHGEVNATFLRAYQIQSAAGGVMMPFSALGVNSSFFVSGSYMATT